MSDGSGPRKAIYRPVSLGVLAGKPEFPPGLSVGTMWCLEPLSLFHPLHVFVVDISLDANVHDIASPHSQSQQTPFQQLSSPGHFCRSLLDYPTMSNY